MKKYLFKLLGRKYYLRSLHLSFHFLYNIGALKNDYIYKYHYFDKKVIQKGDVVLDIGANLGYYTKLFARWTGSKGHVYAVEPIAIFAETIKWGAKNYKNITIYNYALGEDEKEVTLSAPGDYGYLRTGLPSVDKDNKPKAGSDFTFKAIMKKGSELFKDLPKIDFIKMDIEGYEYIVLLEMVEVIKKHKPVIQVETWGEHKPIVEEYLTSLGYKIYDIETEEGVLKPFEEIKNWVQGDLMFIHNENKSVIDRLKKIHAVK